MRFNFSKVAKEFKLIEENTKLIYINKETRAEELLNELKIKGASKERLREAMVNIDFRIYGVKERKTVY